jgi:C-terminal processing protease CtpA/Prc
MLSADGAADLREDISKQTLGRELFSRVIGRMGDIGPEDDYFGLYIAGEQPARWLDLNEPVAKQVKTLRKTGGQKKKHKYSKHTFQLAVGVKFFVSHPSKLVTPDTRWYVFHQLLDDMRTGKFEIIGTDLRSQMVALSCQATLGDFNEHKHSFPWEQLDNAIQQQSTYLHTATGLFPANTPKDALRKTHQFHDSLRGVAADEAVFMFLQQAVQQETYGCEFFVGVKLSSARGTPKVGVSVSCNGIRIYSHDPNNKVDRRSRLYAFTWPEIGHIAFKKANFKVVLRPARVKEKQVCIKLKFKSNDECVAMWSLAVHKHTFHRRRRIPAERGARSPMGVANMTGRTEAEVLVRAQSRGGSRRPQSAMGRSPLIPVHNGFDSPLRTSPTGAGGGGGGGGADTSTPTHDHRQQQQQQQQQQQPPSPITVPTQPPQLLLAPPPSTGKWVATADNNTQPTAEAAQGISNGAWFDEVDAIMAAGGSRPVSPDDDELPMSPDLDETTNEQSFLAEKSLLGGYSQERLGYQLKALYSYVPSSEDEIDSPGNYEILSVQVGKVFLCLDISQSAMDKPGSDWWLVEHPDHPGAMAVVPSIVGCAKIALTRAFDSADYYDPVELVSPSDEMIRPAIVLGTLKGLVSNALTENYMEKYIGPVPYTTRALREEDDEEEGLDYHFVTHDRMNEMLDQNVFCEVSKFNLNLYGTPYESIRQASIGYQCVFITCHINPGSILSTISLLERQGGMFPAVIFLREPDANTMESLETDFAPHPLPLDVTDPASISGWQQVEQECAAVFASVIDCTNTTLSDLTAKVDEVLSAVTRASVWVHSEGELPDGHPLAGRATSPPPPLISIPPPPPPQMNKPGLILEGANGADGESATETEGVAFAQHVYEAANTQVVIISADEIQAYFAVRPKEHAQIGGAQFTDPEYDFDEFVAAVSQAYDAQTTFTATQLEQYALNGASVDSPPPPPPSADSGSLTDQIKAAADRRKSSSASIGNDVAGTAEAGKRKKSQPAESLEDQLLAAVRRRSQVLPEEEEIVGQTNEAGRDPASSAMALPSATWKPKSASDNEAKPAKSNAPEPKMSFEDEMAAAMKRRMSAVADDSTADNNDTDPDMLARLKQAADNEDARIAAATPISPNTADHQKRGGITSGVLQRSQSLTKDSPKYADSFGNAAGAVETPEQNLLSGWGVGGGGGGSGGGGNANVDTDNNNAAPPGTIVGEMYTEMVVEFDRFPAGFGFSFAGGIDCPDEVTGDTNIYVKTLHPGGAADSDGRMKLHDRIIEANNTVLMGVKHDTVTEILRSNYLTVNLKLIRRSTAVELTLDELAQQKYEKEMAEYEIQQNQYLLDQARFEEEQARIAQEQARVDAVAVEVANIPRRSPSGPTAGDNRLSSFGGFDANATAEVTTESTTETPTTDWTKVVAEEVVEIEKNIKGQLGLTIGGGIDVLEGDGNIYVARIIPLQPASLDGRLKVGDRILNVNGITFDAVTQQTAIQTLKNSPATITITIARHVIRILLQPNGGRYGVALGGGAQLHKPLSVKKIQADSAAAGSDLKEGDQVYKINGFSGSTLTLSEANTMIKASIDGLDLLIFRKV